MPKIQEPQTVVEETPAGTKTEKPVRARKSPSVGKTPKAKKSKESAGTEKVAKAPKPEKKAKEPSSTPAGERKQKVVAYLQKAGCTKQSQAIGITDLGTKVGMTRREVYSLLRGAAGKADSDPRCLVASGMVVLSDVEEQGMSCHLSQKGAKTKFDCPPFVK